MIANWQVIGHILCIMIIFRGAQLSYFGKKIVFMNPC